MVRRPTARIVNWIQPGPNPLMEMGASPIYGRETSKNWPGVISADASTVNVNSDPLSGVILATLTGKGR